MNLIVRFSVICYAFAYRTVYPKGVHQKVSEYVFALDEYTGPPQLVAEMHNCPELGGDITLECRIKNAPQHERLKVSYANIRVYVGRYRYTSC